MAGVSFSIIVPTSGRPSLKNALASIAEQLAPGDEVFVLRDDSNDEGDTPRNSAIPRARGTHLLFMDDDDQYARAALARIRRFAELRRAIVRVRKLPVRIRYHARRSRVRRLFARLR